MNAHARFVYRLSATAAIATGVLVVVIVGFELYVRWFLNQNFTFLGGFGLEALIIAFVGELFALVWVTR